MVSEREMVNLNLYQVHSGTFEKKQNDRVGTIGGSHILPLFQRHRQLREGGSSFPVVRRSRSRIFVRTTAFTTT